ncbi:unnamed protein product, partial [marine sediment metagenome]
KPVRDAVPIIKPMTAQAVTNSSALKAPSLKILIIFGIDILLVLLYYRI